MVYNSEQCNISTKKNMISKFKEFSSLHNNNFFRSDLNKAGFKPRDIEFLIKEGYMERFSYGYYVSDDGYEDIFKRIQGRNNNIIFSHETALYLHDMTDVFPSEYTLTTYSGNHIDFSKKQNINKITVKYVKKSLINMGVEEMTDNYGNKIKVYNRERTICDLIKIRNHVDSQTFVQGIQSYFLYGDGRIRFDRFDRYSKALGISKEVSDIVMLFTEP